MLDLNKNYQIKNFQINVPKWETKPPFLPWPWTASAQKAEFYPFVCKTYVFNKVFDTVKKKWGRYFRSPYVTALARAPARGKGAQIRGRSEWRCTSAGASAAGEMTSNFTWESSPSWRASRPCSPSTWANASSGTQVRVHLVHSAARALITALTCCTC